MLGTSRVPTRPTTRVARRHRHDTDLGAHLFVRNTATTRQQTRQPSTRRRIGGSRLNGTIAATTRIAGRTDGVQLTALPPERLWHDGRNDVVVFLLRETAGGVELSPLSPT